MSAKVERLDDNQEPHVAAASRRSADRDRAGITAAADLPVDERENSPAGDLDRVRSLVESARVEEARSLAQTLHERWPEDGHVQYWARVLAPPVVRRRPDVRLPGLGPERSWLQRNARNYPGCWIAVKGDQLLACDPDPAKVLDSVRAIPDGRGALLHYQPRPAE